MKTLEKKSLATELAVNGCFNPRKWAYLEKMSTTTKMQLTDPDMGNPSMKSIEMIHQA